MDGNYLNALLAEMGLPKSENVMRELNSRAAPAAAAAGDGAAPAAAAPAAEPPAGRFDEHLITQPEITEVINFKREDNKPYYPTSGPVGEIAASMLRKVRAGGGAMRRSHTFQARDYPTVYISSDIHSDYRKLVQVLKGMGLIDTPIDPYAGDAIYNPELIFNVRWTGGSNTLLVFVGDIVDGYRDFGEAKSKPDDRLGMFEYLLFCFLYNLRIRALAQNSDVICIIGNHEVMTVIDPKINEGSVKKYVTPEVLSYFGMVGVSYNLAIKTRSLVLKEFITNVWPYFMISIVNGEQKEVACVHGGLHNFKRNYATDPRSGKLIVNKIKNKDGQFIVNDNTKIVETIQTTIDETNNLNKFFEIYDPDKFGFDYDSPIWSRDYSADAEGFCHHIGETPYPLIAVGHCVTSMMDIKRFNHLRRGRPECSDGSDKVGHLGCVYVDCINPARGGPQIAFVDTGLSEGQRFPIDHPDYLKDEHDNYKPIRNQNGQIIGWEQAAEMIPKLDNSTRAIEYLRLRHDPAAVPAPEGAVGGAGAAAPVPRFYNVVERVRSDNHAITIIHAGAASAVQGGGRRTNRRRTNRRRTNRRRTNRRRM